MAAVARERCCGPVIEGCRTPGPLTRADRISLVRSARAYALPVRGEPPVADPRAGLEREVRRVADRLRVLSPARLAEPVAGHASRAAAGRTLAQALADAAARLEADPQVPAARRVLPVLADGAVGEQVAVTGTDLLLAAAQTSPADAPRALEILAAAREQVTAVRRAL